MYTGNYEYTKTNVIKIILTNKNDEVLLIQEPKDNDWMPLHWGLPGGKPTERESLREAFERKVKTDIGLEVDLKGIFRVYELLIEGRTVIMYIVVAQTDGEEVSGEAKDYKWMSKEDVEKMEINDFTEYYNKELLSDFFKGKNEYLSLDIIKPLEYYSYDDNKEYQGWLASGTKE